jgi:hypothetical protein
MLAGSLLVLLGCDCLVRAAASSACVPAGFDEARPLQAAISSGDMSTEGLEEEAWLVLQQHQEKLYAAGGKQATATQAHED